MNEVIGNDKIDNLQAEIAYWRNEIYLANVKLDELCQELNNIYVEQTNHEYITADYIVKWEKPDWDKINEFLRARFTEEHSSIQGDKQ